MFKKIVDTLKAVFYGRTLIDTYEDMLVQEQARKIVEVDTPVPTTIVVEKPTKAVNDQITDSVTAKPKRARGPKGKLKADDKSTPDVNEAWVGGKAPAKKTKTKNNK